MYIVDFLHAFDFQDGPSDVFHAQIKRAAFQKNVGGLAQDADAGPEHEQADGQTEKRINPARAGRMNNQRASDDGDIGQRTAKIWNETTAWIQFAPPPYEENRAPAISGRSG